MNPRSHLAIALILLLWWTSASFGQTLGQAPTEPFAPVMKPVMAHIRWTERDGAPGNIAALAQTTDGYLWLGTPLGLYRFDGLQFASYPTSSMEPELAAFDIDALTADQQGGLWIGYRLGGGISHLSRDGVLTTYNNANHLGPKFALKIIVRPDHSVWAIADNKLLVLNGNHWEDFGKAHGLPDEPLWSLFFDSRGNLWTSARKKLYVLHPGHASFDLYPTQTFIVVDVAETTDGRIWLSDGWRTIRTLEPGAAIPVKGYTRMLIEPSGTIWLAQDYRGVSHLQPTTGPGPPPALVEETELTSEQTNALLRDRDGDIWVGTSRGLDRFQSSPLQALSGTRVEYYPALASDVTSGVWIATLSHPLLHASGTTLTALGPEIGSTPMVCDDHGRVWIVDPLFNMLTEYDGSTISRVPAPPQVHHVPAQSIGLDFDGAILVSFDEAGLWRFNGQWEEVHDGSLPAEHSLTIFRDPDFRDHDFSDQDHRVWLGYPDSRIVLRDRHGMHPLTPSQTADLGNVLTFARSRNHLWAAGTKGLAFLDHGSFHLVTLARGAVLRGISGIIEDKSGGLWLNTSTGILRIRAEELDKLSHGPATLDYDLLDDRQGVDGTATQIKPTPSAVADRSGLLWFSMSGAVYSLDPQAVSLRQSVPALSLENVSINGVPVLDREHQSTNLKTGAAALRELEIDYIGVDLSSPEKVTYQYMLEGEDKTWREVGNRRQAFYSHLRPAHYRFRVRATNGSSPWQELAAPLDLTITPAFYQTAWFYLLSALAVLTLLYLLYLLRMQSLTNRLKDRLKERSDERLRIARALHDTLLQSVHGLMLRFHFAAQTLPEKTPARQSLELALHRADAVYLEARSEVESLRDEVAESLSHAETMDLATLIAKRAEELEIQPCITFQLVEQGQRQALHPATQSELYRIASEALTNTLLHAQSTAARITLTYSSSELTMMCSDNGVGLPPAVLATGQRDGHWGLIGIRERASTIEARLQITSAPGSGTHIELRVPARRAYLYPGTRLIWLQRLLRFRRTATGEDSTPRQEA